MVKVRVRVKDKIRVEMVFRVRVWFPLSTVLLSIYFSSKTCLFYRDYKINKSWNFVLLITEQ